MQMRMRAFVGAAVLTTVLAAGCSDDVVGFNTDCSNLLGTFRATSLTVTSTDGTPTTVNLLAADSAALDITFGTDSYSSSFKSGAGHEALVISGSTAGSTDALIRLSNSSIIAAGGGNPSYTCKIDGEELTLEAPASTYIFSGETAARAARVSIKLKNQGGV